MWAVYYKNAKGQKELSMVTLEKGPWQNKHDALIAAHKQGCQSGIKTYFVDKMD